MDYAKRLNRLRHLLQTLPCEALLVEHPVDLLYLTGLELSTGKLLISQQDACLIVDGRYFERSQQQSLYPVQLLKAEAMKEWLVDHAIHALGFSQEHTSYQTYVSLTQLAAALAPYALEIVPLDSPIQKLRLIKDADEIERLRAAGKLCYEGFEFIESLLSEGITEYDLAFELEFFWKKRGGSRFSFDPIIAFGPNGSMPHYRAGKTALQRNTSVLIDIGVMLAHYHSDMTRVVFFGTPSEEIQTIYRIVDEAKSAALAQCKPGTCVGELDRIAREWITTAGYGECFTHSLGHGVGLDVHELPIIRRSGPSKDMPLESGMVITIEPGIYLPNQGGVRLEDTILITEKGYENLTRSQ